jgi:hypothetical protein
VRTGGNTRPFVHSLGGKTTPIGSSSFARFRPRESAIGSITDVGGDDEPILDRREGVQLSEQGHQYRARPVCEGGLTLPPADPVKPEPAWGRPSAATFGDGAKQLPSQRLGMDLEVEERAERAALVPDPSGLVPGIDDGPVTHGLASDREG